MAAISINTPGNGLVYNTFLNSQLSTPRLCITSEEGEFDTETIRNWQNEGFEVTYVPLDGGGKEYAARLESMKEGLRVGEQYAIIAYGHAASFCLDHFHKPTTGARLTALVAYYPTAIPDTRTKFPPSLKVLVHLAGESVDVVTTPQVLGIQGRKKRVTRRRIDTGVGIGERKDISYTAFTYDFADPGFAEHDLDEYDHASAELAWSRTLDVMRKAFRKDADLERPWEINTESKLFTDNLSQTMETYVTHKNPAVTFGPTLAGGIGAKALRRFYENDFLQTKPPSMRLRLLSRTVGADRVVDEIYTSFEHTVEMPWMLPGVPPTGKRVELILVAIISLKAERIFTEHLYWDQASVLVQVGLLDPKLLPEGAGAVKTLPVTGREAARRILGEYPARGDEYHKTLIASAKTPAGKKSRQSTPKPSNRNQSSASIENIEQRNVGTSVNGKDTGESSNANGSSGKRTPKKLGTSKEGKGKAPEGKINDFQNREVPEGSEGKEGDGSADAESEAAPPVRPMGAQVESDGE
ncbi:hypothetical protein UA08_02178 [Talaromyces atroroseus]|uniref:Dienelactone hydrolase n=1 Tax=Talaromyces atroroseus TaxID=1441469 RepID=A0A225AWK2_TALAT|nr:hypothetical protein UA08_02178 [Talaromyces atroroseus]OKL61698.1 hypothetical protein UA08_02178 [Talaromyces atroroseus]